MTPGQLQAKLLSLQSLQRLAVLPPGILLIHGMSTSSSGIGGGDGPGMSEKLFFVLAVSSPHTGEPTAGEDCGVRMGFPSTPEHSGHSPAENTHILSAKLCPLPPKRAAAVSCMR